LGERTITKGMKRTVEGESERKNDGAEEQGYVETEKEHEELRLKIERRVG